MQLMQALHRLAAAHETGPAFDAVLTYQYDNIIKHNVAHFIKSLISTTSSSMPTWLWYYVAGSKVVEEAKGIHG